MCKWECVGAVEQYQGMYVRYLRFGWDGWQEARKPWITQEIIVKWMNEGREIGSTMKKE
jgi:hypothetical protein